jgi:DNA polymerase delta subunit 1
MEEEPEEDDVNEVMLCYVVNEVEEEEQIEIIEEEDDDQHNVKRRKVEDVLGDEKVWKQYTHKNEEDNAIDHLDIQVSDITCGLCKIKESLDDPLILEKNGLDEIPSKQLKEEEDLTQEEEEELRKISKIPKNITKRKWTPPPKPRKVPVFHLFGRTSPNGNSITLNVYGFYPKVYLLSSVPLTDNLISDICENVEKNLIRGCTVPKKEDMPSYCWCKQPILSWSIVKGFPGYPFSEEVGNFIQFTLSNPTLVNKFSKIYAQGDSNCYQFTTNLDQNIYLKPFGCYDTISQFISSTGIGGESWIKIAKRDLQYDCNHFVVSNLEFNCNVSSPHLFESDKVAFMRGFCFDIECLCDKGFPVPEKDSIILICIRLFDIIDGFAEEKSIRDVVLQLGSANIDQVVDKSKGHIHLCFEKEAYMLHSFGTLLKSFDPDFLIGHNAINFDIPYVTTRSHLLNVDNADSLGRMIPYKWEKSREMIKKRGKSEWKTYKTSIPGRLQLDTLAQIKSFWGEKLRSFSLGYLAQEYLQDNKESVDPKQIKPLHERSNATRTRLAKYCWKDTFLTYRLATHKNWQMIYSIIEMSKITKVIPNRILLGGTQERLKQLMLDTALNPKFDNENHPVIWPYENPKERTDKFKGAFVEPPTRGFYNTPIAVLDYASLYPSVMIYHNICYTTTLLNPIYKQRHAYDESPEKTCYVKSNVRKGILPIILETLLEKRKQAKNGMALAIKQGDKAKSIMYDKRQLLLKLAANSMYGMLTASGGWLVRVENGLSVTSWGRTMIDFAHKIAASPPFNARILYGDTDSVMIQFPNSENMSKEEAFAKMKQVTVAVNANFPKPVEIQPEKIYQPFLLVNKKRYAGMKYMRADDPEPKMDIKGLEIARRDNCSFVVEFMRELLNKIMQQQSPQTIINFLKKVQSDLFTGKVPFSKLIISASMSKLEYKGKVAHVECAKRMQKRDPNYTFSSSDRIPYVIICNGSNLKSEKAEDPWYVLQNDLELDYVYYMQNQMAKPVSRLLMWIFSGKKLMDHLRRIEHSATDEDIKKVLKKMEKETNDRFFGPGALLSITRKSSSTGKGALSKWIIKKRVCPACSFVELKNGFCDECMESDRSLEFCKKFDADLVDVEDQINALKKKCESCRGDTTNTNTTSVGGEEKDKEKVVVVDDCKNTDCNILFEKKYLEKRYESTKSTLSELSSWKDVIQSRLDFCKGHDEIKAKKLSEQLLILQKRTIEKKNID